MTEELVRRLFDEVEGLKRANTELRAEMAALRSSSAVDGGNESCPDEGAVTRRGLLKKVGGVAAAGVAGAMGVSTLTPSRAAAAEGDPVLLGRYNEVVGRGTFIANNLGEYAFLADPNARVGVYARHRSRGAVGEIYGASAGIGVEGKTSGHNSEIGVRGTTLPGNGEGIGVHGITANGYGVLAESTTLSGAGLVVRGRAFFSRSGTVVFAQGQTSKPVPAGRLDSYSIVLATIQGNPAGTWVRAVSLDTTNERFTIRLNKAAPANLTVGWFIVN
jgi:hypothetical protein